MQLEQAQDRIFKVSRIIKRLYEDNVNGKIFYTSIISLSHISKYGGNIIILDSRFGEEFGKKSPLYLLGKSLELLAEADIAIFGSGWEQSRGCRIEHTCCEEYGIPMEYAK